MNYLIWNPLGVEDQCLMMPDGWIVVARVAPYRIDWISPSGKITVGPPIPRPEVVVDERIKRAALNRIWFGPFRSRLASEEVPGWPALLPPFLNDALLATPDHRVVIRRLAAAVDDRPEYDLFSRAGDKSSIRLKQGEALIGFGRGRMYVTTRVDEHSVRLERRSWP
ncbi:MAG TPA: hypothetical protein VK636_02870 [Gemmatimonadaceae bacterium]|nr:hypothetical protein [Gemmatimonadaceae bacterium]